MVKSTIEPNLGIIVITLTTNNVIKFNDFTDEEKAKFCQCMNVAVDTAIKNILVCRE